MACAQKLSESIKEVGIVPTVVIVYRDDVPYPVVMTAEVKDWGRLLRAAGIDDEILANHMRRWNGALEVKPPDGAQFFTYSAIPLPKAYVKNGHIDEEEFLRRYGTGDELRDAVLIAALSKYDPGELRATITEAINARINAFLEDGNTSCDRSPKICRGRWGECHWRA